MASGPPAPSTAVEAPGWVVQISPYVWAAGLKGNVSPFRRAPTLSIDKSFSDILDGLEMGGFVSGWARYDRVVLSADIMYVDVAESRAIGALPRLGQTPGLSAKVDTTQFVATLQAGYRVFESPNVSLDLLGGVRWWEISTDATVQYSGFAVHYGSAFGWVDPVIGLRGFYRFTDRLSTVVQADVGGFGASSNSTWQILATLNYAFSDRLAGSIGYKVLDVDYSSDGHVFDTRLSGPVLGVTVRF